MIGFAHRRRVLQTMRANATGFQRKQHMCQIACNRCFSVDSVLNSWRWRLFFQVCLFTQRTSFHLGKNPTSYPFFTSAIVVAKPCRKILVIKVWSLGSGCHMLSRFGPLLGTRNPLQSGFFWAVKPKMNENDALFTVPSPKGGEVSWFWRKYSQKRL